jgi:large subunit ribosomal protein L9
VNIEVVLTETDPKLGKRGEIVKVSSGYAQNFLFPHKKAVPATPANRAAAEAQKARQSKQDAEALAAARETAVKISASALVIEMMAGESDKLYGAVTNQDVAASLAGRGIRVDRRDIHLEEPIRRLGDHSVTLKLHPEVTATLQIKVIAKK